MATSTSRTIMVVASVESDTNVIKQIAKQTIQPDYKFIYIDQDPAKGIDNRRKRIAENQYQLRQAVNTIKPDLVWQVEGDVDLQNDTLERLLNTYDRTNDNRLAYVSGIQVGRHGLYCLGAWVDITDDSFESLDYKKTGIQKVDATGLYCLLTTPEIFNYGEVEWNGEPYGPDVVWGRQLTQNWYNIYCDMSITIGHFTGKNAIIKVEHPSTCNAKFYKDNNNIWQYKQYD